MNRQCSPAAEPGSDAPGSLPDPVAHARRTIHFVHVEFTDEQRALRKLVRDFAEAEIAPHAEAWDASHTFPVDVVRQMGDLGLFGIPFPEEYGGGGADLTTLCIAIEELARVDQSMAITLEAGVGLGANPIYRFGTEQQRQQWLPDLCAGRALGGFGLTEPEAGSDAGAPARQPCSTEARGEWVVNGAKAFITNSGTDITSLVTITARTGGDRAALRRSRASSCRPARPVSASTRPTARWGGTPPTPTG